uniref:Envelope glycoprotein gC n=1 Tax=Human herpesvirus 3 TaxID=10335 RepID=Q0Q908_HHV3|nr:envelope glycoprotein gC [Human alphaherpesvirus 3]
MKRIQINLILTIACIQLSTESQPTPVSITELYTSAATRKPDPAVAPTSAATRKPDPAVAPTSAATRKPDPAVAPTSAATRKPDPAVAPTSAATRKPDPAVAPTSAATRKPDPAVAPTSAASRKPDPAVAPTSAATRKPDPAVAPTSAATRKPDPAVAPTSAASRKPDPAANTQHSQPPFLYENIQCVHGGIQSIPYFHTFIMPCYMRLTTGQQAAFKQQQKTYEQYSLDPEGSNITRWKSLIRPDLHIEVWFTRHLIDPHRQLGNALIRMPDLPVMLYSNSADLNLINNPEIFTHAKENYVIPDVKTTSDFSVTILSMDATTEGTYIWRVVNTKTKNVISEHSITVTTYYRPNITVVGDPVLTGQTYAAYCNVSKYYPPHSVRVRWTSRFGNIGKNFITDAIQEYANGLFSYVSAVRIPQQKQMDYPPPAIQCNVLWIRDGVSNMKYSAVVTPDVYPFPNVSIGIIDGHIVCTAKCVPRGVVHFVWWVNDSPINHENSEITGVCDQNKRFVNMQSSCPTSELDGPITYSCHLDGYPKKFPPFSAVYTYDASTYATTFSVVAVIIGVISILGTLGLIAVIATLCIRCCS